MGNMYYSVLTFSRPTCPQLQKFNNEDTISFLLDLKKKRNDVDLLCQKENLVELN